MTPEERDALINQYVTKREDVTPEVWAKMQESERRMQEKIDRGEVLTTWRHDDTPIGLHSKTFEPFPLTQPEEDDTQRTTKHDPEQNRHQD